MKFESMAFSSHEILSNRILGPWKANQYFSGAIKFQSIKFSGCEPSLSQAMSTGPKLNGCGIKPSWQLAELATDYLN